MSNSSPLISVDTLVEIVSHSIRKDITEEYLPAGEKINLNDLCARYGVSPTPIKQALNRLIAEGLVENIPRKGYRIRRFSWDDADELFEMRLMMELHVVPLAAVALKSSPLLQEKFERNISENLALVQSFQTPDEYFQIYEKDQQFHALLILSGGNRIASRMYQSLNTHSYAAYLYGKQPRHQTISGIVEHQAIYESLRDGDTAQVCALIHSHVEHAQEKIRLSLKLRQND